MSLKYPDSGRRLVPIHPLPNNSVGLLRLLPEKTMAAAFDHLVLGAFDIVAQVLGRNDVIAGVGVHFVFATNDTQRRRGDLVQVFAGLMAVTRHDMFLVGVALARVIPKRRE